MNSYVLMRLTPNKYSHVARLLSKYLTTSSAAVTFDRHEALQSAKPSQFFPKEEQKLSALTLVHCNYETQVDVDSVCKLYLEKRPVRIECDSLLFEM